MLRKKINFRRVEKKIVGGRINKLRLEAENIKVGIVNRTVSGKDTKNKRFKRYSSAYAENKGTLKVDLTDTGAMLGAISSKKIANGFRFYFNSKNDRDKAYWNNKTRKFFGMDSKQVKYLKKKIGKL